MSQENVELVYRLNDAFKRRDLDAYLALCDPDVEYYSRFGEVEGGGPYRGHEGVRSWWEKRDRFTGASISLESRL
jgi:ketosteroid isomerase-like protein